jgi:hypothetical protein
MTYILNETIDHASPSMWLSEQKSGSRKLVFA